MLGREERIKTLKTLDEKLQYVANRVTELQPKAESDKVDLHLGGPEITVLELLHIDYDELQKEISKANNMYRIWTTPVIGEIANSLYSVANALYSVPTKILNAFINKDPGANILLGSNFFTHEDYFSEAKSLTGGHLCRLKRAEEHLDEGCSFRFNFAEEHLEKEPTIFDNTIDFAEAYLRRDHPILDNTIVFFPEYSEMNPHINN